MPKTKTEAETEREAQQAEGEVQAQQAEAEWKVAKAEAKEAMRAALHAPRVSAEDKAKAEAKASTSDKAKTEARLPWGEVASYLSPVEVAFETKVDFRGESFIATTGGKGEQAVCIEAGLTEAEEEVYLDASDGRLVTKGGLDRAGELAVLALHVEDEYYGLEVERVEGNLAGTFALVGDTTCTKHCGLKPKYGTMHARPDSHRRTDLK